MQTGVIYEKHRVDAYHNLGLGMQNTRLKQEVSLRRLQTSQMSHLWTESSRLSGDCGTRVANAVWHSCVYSVLVIALCEDRMCVAM